MAELVAVKGIGEWTAHMFLMIHLHRPDVMAPGDLGIRRAIERAYSLEDARPRDDGAPRGALAAAPHARLPLPLALAEQRTRLARQTAETCSSSATRNEQPQPQAATTFGFSTLKPAPGGSPGSRYASRRRTRRLRSTSSLSPWLSKTRSSSRCSSKASWYWKPEQPPPRTPTRSPARLTSACCASRNSRDLLGTLVGHGDHCFPKYSARAVS